MTHRIQFSIVCVISFVAILAISVAWWKDHQRLDDDCRRLADQLAEVAARNRAANIWTQSHTAMELTSNEEPVSITMHFVLKGTFDPAYFRNLVSVREVTFAYHPKLASRFFDQLRALPKLEIVRLYDGERYIGPFGTFPGPRHQVTDKHLEILSTISTIKEIDLGGLRFSMLGIEQLGKLSKLERITLRPPSRLEIDMHGVRTALPGIEIVVEDELPVLPLVPP